MDYRKIITEICRFILGATFLFSGFVKAVDPVGGVLIMENYFGAFGLSAFNPLALFTSINLSAIEFLLGLCILLAVYRKLTTLCMLVFMIFMTVLTLYLAIFNPVHDCGCFGQAIILTNLQTFLKNALVLLPAAIVTSRYHKKMTPVYTYHVYWFAVVFGYLFAVGFALYNYYHLPLVDFLPYKTGVNIPQQMSFPEDAPQDIYHFIYEKNGKKQTFAPDQAPFDDESWKFVDRKLIKQGYVPPIAAFNLHDENENNIADILLEDTKGVFLLISPNLEKASDKHIDEINNIFDYAVEKGLLFYCVTSSSKEDIRTWIHDTGAEYPFLTADDVMLKSIVRANPGLVLLKSGTILGKWNHNDIPSEETAETVMEELLNPHKEKKSEELPQSLWFCCCFVLPLLIVWSYDYLRNRRKKI
jgi:uncharacterized membrane protein YphA (DoxX/SURF4 family)